MAEDALHQNMGHMTKDAGQTEDGEVALEEKSEVDRVLRGWNIKMMI